MSDELITNLSFKIDGSPIESLQGITEQLNNTFTKTEEEVAKINGRQSDTFKKTKTNIDTAKNSTIGFTEALSQSDNMLDEVGRSTGSATNNIGKLTINIKNYNKQVKESKKSTETFSGSAKGLTQQVKSLAASYISVQALKNGIKLYANFSDQMVRVKGLTRASAKEYDLLVSSAKRFGATTSFSSSQVGEAYTELAQKGYSVNKIIKTTPGILGLAETSSMGLAETTKILTGVMNAYNASAEESMYYADVIAKGQTTASVTTQSLGDAYGYSATRAKSLGYDVKQLTSWIMALGDSQIEGSAAGTGLNATFSDLINKGDKLKKIGVNVYDPLTKKMRGLEDIALDLGKATSKMTEQQKNYTLSQIFGEQSTRVMAVMMSTGAKKSKDYQKELANSAGTSAEFSKIMNSEMGGSLRGLSSALEGAALSMMTTLSPAIIGITNMITALANGVNWFFDLINENDWIQSLVAGLMGAAIAAKVLSAAFTLLNLTNPFGWIVIAIGAGIAAITFLEKKFQIFSKTAEKIKGFFGFGSDDKDQGVSQQVKEIPKHAKGTDNAPGGISLVGEEGPELVQMPRGARVFTANETKEILSNHKNQGLTTDISPKSSAYNTLNTVENNNVSNIYKTVTNDYKRINNENSVIKNKIDSILNENSSISNSKVINDIKNYSTVRELISKEKSIETKIIPNFIKPSYQKVEEREDKKSTKKDKGHSVMIEGSKYEFNFSGTINNFEDIKEKLERWLDKREMRREQKLKGLLGGV